MRDSRRHEAADLYELLQVSPRASQDVIQAAYRVLARSYHPDVNATTEAGHRIRKLNDAYNVLSDPQTRACYDLARTRARRHEWLVDAVHAPARTNLTRAERARPPSASRAGAVARPIEDRLSVLNGQVILGMILVAMLAVVVFALIWASLDAAVDSPILYRGPAFGMYGQ